MIRDDLRDGFIIGRNPDEASRLPDLLRLPVAGERDVVLATSGRWPSGKDLFCDALTSWPPEADVLETVAVERCRRAARAAIPCATAPRLDACPGRARRARARIRQSCMSARRTVSPRG